MHNKMDLNTYAGFMEVRKYRLSNQTLNTHKIITREMNPEVGAKKVRRWYDVDTTLIRRKWGALNDRIKVVRIRIIQIN